jgi:uncharacterized protein YeaO (DUF488 family)
MPVRIVQLGSPRHPDEGLRIGTVRRPPRGVPKAEFASRDYYDVWYPELSPQPDTMHTALESHRLLAALSQHSAFAIGCYCEHEARCHRGILRSLLKERGADIAHGGTNAGETNTGETRH